MKVTITPLRIDTTGRQGTGEKICLEALISYASMRAEPGIGQVVWFPKSSFGQIIAVKRLEHSHVETPPQFWIKLHLFQGIPRFHSQEAHIYGRHNTTQTLERLLGKIDIPLEVGEGGNIIGDLSYLGPLTRVTGNTLSAQIEALSFILRQIATYEEVLVLDTLGLVDQAAQEGVLSSSSSSSWRVETIGPQAGLSVQQLGLNAFFKGVTGALPEAIQSQAIELLAKRTPATPDFIPYRHYLKAERYEDSPAKSLLLHELFRLYEYQVFADEEDRVFSWMETVTGLSGLQEEILTVNLANLPRPWPEIVYQRWLYQWFELSEKTETNHAVMAVIGSSFSADILQEMALQAELRQKHLILAGEPLSSLQETLFAANNIHGIWYPQEQAVVIQAQGWMTGGVLMETPLHGVWEEEDESDLPEERIEQEEAGRVTWPEESAKGPATMAVPSKPSFQETRPEELELKDLALKELEKEEEEEFYFQGFPEPPDSPVLSSSPVFPQAEKSENRDEALNAIFGVEEEQEFFFELQPEYEQARPTSVYPVHEVSPEITYQVLSVTPKEEEFSIPLDPLEIQQPQAEKSHHALLQPALPSTQNSLTQNLPSQDQVPVYPAYDPEQEAMARHAGFREGDKVIHEKYGEGVIERIIPIEERLTLKVIFESVGKRLLDAEASPLRKI